MLICKIIEILNIAVYRLQHSPQFISRSALCEIVYMCLVHLCGTTDLYEQYVNMIWTEIKDSVGIKIARKKVCKHYLY